MKRICIFLLIIMASQAQAQTYTFSKLKSYLSVGYAYPNIYNKNTYSWNTFFNEIKNSSTSSDVLGPIFVTYERSMSNRWGLGFTAGYSQQNYTFSENNITKFSYKNQYIPVLVRATYHPWELTKWDPYVGAALGYNIALKNEWTDSLNYRGRFGTANPPSMLYNVFVGVRNWRKSVGWFAEAGYSNTHYLQAGVVFRFGPHYYQEDTVW